MKGQAGCLKLPKNECCSVRRRHEDLRLVFWGQGGAVQSTLQFAPSHSPSE